MYALLSIVIIAVCCVMIIRFFINDNKHDLEIQAGKFKISIKKHDKIT